MLIYYIVLYIYVCITYSRIGDWHGLNATYQQEVFKLQMRQESFHICYAFEMQRISTILVGRSLTLIHCYYGI